MKVYFQVGGNITQNNVNDYTYFIYNKGNYIKITDQDSILQAIMDGRDKVTITESGKVYEIEFVYNPHNIPHGKMMIVGVLTSDTSKQLPTNFGLQSQLVKSEKKSFKVSPAAAATVPVPSGVQPLLPAADVPHQMMPPPTAVTQHVARTHAPLPPAPFAAAVPLTSLRTHGQLPSAAQSTAVASAAVSPKVMQNEEVMNEMQLNQLQLQIERDSGKPLSNSILNKEQIKEDLRNPSRLIIFTLQYPYNIDGEIPHNITGSMKTRNKKYFENYTHLFKNPGTFPGKSGSHIIQIYLRRFGIHGNFAGEHSGQNTNLVLDVNNDDTSNIHIVLFSDTEEYKRKIFSKIGPRTHTFIIGHCGTNLDYVISDIQSDGTQNILPASQLSSMLKLSQQNDLGTIFMNACQAFTTFNPALIENLQDKQYYLISSPIPIFRLNGMNSKDIFDENQQNGFLTVHTITNDVKHYKYSDVFTNNRGVRESNYVPLKPKSQQNPSHAAAGVTFAPAIAHTHAPLPPAPAAAALPQVRGTQLSSAAAVARSDDSVLQQIMKLPHFFKNINYTDTIELLKNAPVGTYILRLPSDRKPDHFVIQWVPREKPEKGKATLIQIVGKKVKLEETPDAETIKSWEHDTNFLTTYNNEYNTLDELLKAKFSHLNLIPFDDKTPLVTHAQLPPAAAAAAVPMIPPLSKTLLVFDFDCTLTTKHFYRYMDDLVYFNKTWGINTNGTVSALMTNSDRIKEMIMTMKPSPQDKELLINEFFGGQERYAALYNGLTNLKSRGCKIIIASLGIKVQIDALLNCVDMQNLFDEVYGAPLHKEELIAQKINTMQFTNVFYADDDNTQHIQLLKNFKINSEPIDFPLFNQWMLDNVKYYHFKNLNKTFDKDNKTGILLEYLQQIFSFINSLHGQKKYLKIQSENTWKAKYLKYKNKYLQLKKLLD
jgi:hypothetical protein